MPVVAPRVSRYHSLDVWRGVTCLLVATCHASFYVATPEFHQRVLTLSGIGIGDGLLWLVSRLWVVPPMLFVISGYGIGASVDTLSRRESPARFYFTRRLRRVYPPLWVFLVVATVLVGLAEWLRPGLYADTPNTVTPAWQLSPWNWLGTLTLTESWRGYLAGGQGGYEGLLFIHLWTLCYEEQFYIVTGMLLAFWPRRIFTGVLLVSGAVLLVVALVPDGVLEGVFFDGRWLHFAAGMLVYVAVSRFGTRGRALVALLLILAIIYPIRHPWVLIQYYDTRQATYASAFGFALLLLVLKRYDVALAAAPFAQPFAACGRMCYSLYLVHWPIVKGVSHLLHDAGLRDAWSTLLVTIPVCLAVSVLAARVFYQHVERRFLNLPV